MREEGVIVLLAFAALMTSCALFRPPPRIGRFMDRALGEIKDRKYAAASRDLDAALVNDFHPGDEAWRPRANRLHLLVRNMELESHPEDQKELAEDTPAARVAYQAVSAYVNDEMERAMLLAHAALGTDPHNAAYERFLESMGKATGKRVDRDQIAPVQCLAELKMERALHAVYARQFRSAVGLLRDALWLDPGNPAAWTKLGSSYFAMGDKTRAKAAYDRALEIDPGDERLRRFMRRQNLE